LVLNAYIIILGKDTLILNMQFFFNMRKYLVNSWPTNFTCTNKSVSTVSSFTCTGKATISVYTSSILITGSRQTFIDIYKML